MKKTTTSSYDIWLCGVNKTLDNAQGLEDRYKEDHKLLSQYIHVKRRSNYSGKLEKMCEETQKLLEDGKFLGCILVDKPIEPVLKVNAPEIKAFPSLQRPLEQVLEVLRNDKLKGIGISGTLGVGKTTIMKNLNNHEQVAKMFDIFVWANVCSERSEEKLQEVISWWHKLKTEDILYAEDVARSISKELKGKKYFLFLDEVMDSIELEDIGIPDKTNDNKVMFTTEFCHVCSSMADKLVEVRPLSPNKAWMMFKHIVPEVIDLPDIEPVARQFCYDQLNDDQKRKCFLYGALYPEESKIYTDYLLKCWAVEGLVGGTKERRFHVARNEGYHTLKHLTNVSLLEKCEIMIYASMNNNIRQVVLYISSQDPDCKFFTRMSEDSPDCLEENDWQQSKRIAMINKKMQDLPNSPNYSMLLSLFAVVVFQVRTGIGLQLEIIGNMSSLRVDYGQGRISTLEPPFRWRERERWCEREMERILFKASTRAQLRWGAPLFRPPLAGGRHCSPAPEKGVNASVLVVWLPKWLGIVGRSYTVGCCLTEYLEMVQSRVSRPAVLVCIDWRMASCGPLDSLYMTSSSRLKDLGLNFSRKVVDTSSSRMESNSKVFIDR
ncbi:Detected protein of unknown function [Hibiscus syriacus]|uniref:NB-ARC domain-containing protein n=1 Tax=Hibiscus syriacus TaxID=106335 RepID=A0A6A2XYL8_HIBSY|nr:Detected protein of unknown function [Hibiscus syriacus]